MTSFSLFDQPVVQPLERRPFSVLREAALKGTPQQKFDFVASVPIHVEGFRMAREFTEELLSLASWTQHPGGLWIIGNGGVGKSFIMSDIQLRHPPEESQLRRYTPVLGLSFRERPNVSDILIELLLQLGQDPELLHYKRIADLQQYLLEALDACGTKAILFDEAQHLFLSSSKRTKDRFGGPIGDFLKRLYDQSSVAFIFSGTEGLNEYLEVDSQASTRWPGMLKLKPFDYDDHFIGVLRALDEAIPMAHPSGLDSPELSEKMFKSCMGNFRLLKTILCKAVKYASINSHVSIQLEHLHQAHEWTFAQAKNPFLP